MMPGYEFVDLKDQGSKSAFRNCPTRFLILLITIILIVILYVRSDFRLPINGNEDNNGRNLKSFYEIARSTNTTKVGAPELDWRYVRYECIYEDTLAPYRHQRGLKILELGLGCDMWYGPGASHTLWATYFSDPTIYFLEYNKECGEKWYGNLTGKKPTMIYGSQDDVGALRKMVAEYGPWDLIVDDCSHEPQKQLVSFKELFEAVKPAGTYYIEDIGLAPGFKKGTPASRETINFIANLYAESILRQGLGKTLERITCCDQVCGFKTVNPKIIHPPLNF